MEPISDPSRKETDSGGLCLAEGVEATEATWRRIKDDVMPFQKMYFGLEEEDLSYAFEEGVAKVALLRDRRSSRIIGFTYAEPAWRAYGADFHPEREQPRDVCYVQNTAIHADYVGRGLVWTLHDQLYGQLIAGGFRFVERDAMAQNGYAARIQRRYHGSIVFAVPHISRRGEQVYIRMKLSAAHSRWR